MSAEEITRELQHIFGGNLYLTAGFAQFDESSVDLSSISTSSSTSSDSIPAAAASPSDLAHDARIPRSSEKPEFAHARDYVKQIKVRLACIATFTEQATAASLSCKSRNIQGLPVVDAQLPSRSTDYRASAPGCKVAIR